MIAPSPQQPLKVNRLWAAQQYASELAEIYSSMEDNFRKGRKRCLTQSLRILAEACQKATWLVSSTSGDVFDARQMPKDLGSVNSILRRSSYTIGTSRPAEIAEHMETIRNRDGKNFRESMNYAVHSHVIFLWNMTRTVDGYEKFVLQAGRGLVQMGTALLTNAFPADKELSDCNEATRHLEAI
ncbi:MAG: hypothetical protein ACYC92_10545 [Candidatus Acidiferrales bacterium]